MTDYDEDDFYQTDEMICPWCKEVHRDGWELESDDSEYECEYCEKTFGYIKEYSITYTTNRPFGSK
jgi:transposase-like protein